MIEVPKVFSAIAAVQSDMCKFGIEKTRKNDAQGYRFRGIDEVFNALSPVLAAHKLCFLPRIISRVCVERVNAKGTALFYVTVEAEFDLIAAVDGSKHTIRTYGEAMDSGDKATNKAMSAAYKYAALQAFGIPTEGDNDAEATSHAVAPIIVQTSPKWTLEQRSEYKILEQALVSEGAQDKIKQSLEGLRSSPPTDVIDAMGNLLMQVRQEKQTNGDKK